MPEVVFDGIPAKEAIAYIQQRSKKLIPTKHWDDMRGEIHAKAFTVSGATKADLLTDIYAATERTFKDGGTLTDFRRSFDRTVQEHGWQYKGNRGWRTRVIYETNMRTAYAAGQWKRIQATKKFLPYLVYMTTGDSRVRDQHRAWRYTCLPVDDAWWNTHYPPNGWGCRCYVTQVDKAALKRMGLKVSPQAPKIETTERINKGTGEVYGEVPIGIDVGWDYNVGKAWLGPEVAYGKQLAAIDPNLAEQLLEKSRIKAQVDVINHNWKKWVVEAETNGGTGSRFIVGMLPGEVITALHHKKIGLNNAAIEVVDRDLKHLRGTHKGEEKRVPNDIFNNLPERLQNATSVYRLKANGSLIFLFADDLGDKKARAAIQLNFTKQGAVLNSVRSLGVVNTHNLKQQNEYEYIAGERL